MFESKKKVGYEGSAQMFAYIKADSFYIIFASGLRFLLQYHYMNSFLLVLAMVYD